MSHYDRDRMWETREEFKKYMQELDKRVPDDLVEKEYVKPNKYQRDLKGTAVDVYDVLVAFDITCPATAHALKKLLCAGQRGHKGYTEDLVEAIASIERAIELNTGVNFE